MKLMFTTIIELKFGGIENIIKVEWYMMLIKL